MSKKEFVGQISVDAGLCWLGDPCYILHKNNKPESIGRTWAEFCGIIESKDTATFDHNKNIDGLGVVVSTGYGDGLYPVYIKRTKDGHIKEVKVVFIEED